MLSVHFLIQSSNNPVRWSAFYLHHIWPNLYRRLSHGVRNGSFWEATLLGEHKGRTTRSQYYNLTFFSIQTLPNICRAIKTKCTAFFFGYNIWISLYLTGNVMHVHVEKQSPPKIAVDYTRERSSSHLGSSISLLRGKHYHLQFLVFFSEMFCACSSIDTIWILNTV